MKHSDFADVEPLPERFTDEDVRRRFNQLISAAKGASAAIAALLLGTAAFGAGVTVQTAPKGTIYNDEHIVTGVVFNATGLATPEMVTNIVQDVSPAPDFSTNNVELVKTIEAKAPIPTWDAITGKPTTISGYGITDALKSDFTSLTNNAAFTSAVAAVSPPTDLTHVEAEIETNRTAIATLSARAYIEVVSADEVYYVFTTNQE